VELSLPHLNVTTVSRVRVGRRVELTVAADSEKAALAVVDGLAKELLSNPLIEAYTIELLEATSSAVSVAVSAAGSRAKVSRA
jgi:phosphoribosylformylglycinamidine synthase